MRNTPATTWRDMRSPAELLSAAQEFERGTDMPRAIECLELAIHAAERTRDASSLSEGLRKLAIARHLRDESDAARQLAQRSYTVARDAGLEIMAAESLNTLGVQHLQSGNLVEAHRAFIDALALGSSSRVLRGRVQQNLGVVANIRGEIDDAIGHYERSLEAYRDARDEHGCAIAYHNLGMACADRRLLAEAEMHFRESQLLATRSGDASLQALCLVSLADLDVTRQQFASARQYAEEALAQFDQIGERRGKADAYRVLGVVYREIGRNVLAESRLRAALELAELSQAALIEGETSRELALLYQATGRNQEALALLSRAHRVFRRLEARHHVVNIRSKMAALESTYYSVVHAWGASIESSDSATFGHCERVARNAVQMARILGLDDQEETALLMGAYLHDLGMVRVPHEILRKSTPLTREEMDVLQMHPSWGDELLNSAEFPWPVRPIVRWHHERCDGSGYPDGLTGEQIPIAAQVVGILDEFDNLMSPRFGEEAKSADQAAWELVARRGGWSAGVFDAFLKVVR